MFLSLFCFFFSMLCSALCMWLYMYMYTSVCSRSPQRSLVLAEMCTVHSVTALTYLRHTVLCLGSCGFSHVHVHIHLAGSLTRKYPNTKEASANSTKKS